MTGRFGVCLGVLSLVLGLSRNVSAHALLQTRLAFQQEGRVLSLEAVLDPLSLASALKERGVDLRISSASVEEAREEIGFLLDEHLVLSDQGRECPRDIEATRVELGMGSAILVKTRYLCEAEPEGLSIRCDLFSTEGETHLIAATLVARGETLTFVFDARNSVFIAPGAKSAAASQLSFQRVAAVDPRGLLAGVPEALWRGLLHSCSVGHLLLLLGFCLFLCQAPSLSGAIFLLPLGRLTALLGGGLSGLLIEVLFTGGVFGLLAFPLAGRNSPPLPVACCLLSALLALHGLAAAHLFSGLGLSLGRRLLLAASYEIGGALPDLLGLGAAWLFLPKIRSVLGKRVGAARAALLVVGALWLATRLLGGGLF